MTTQAGLIDSRDYDPSAAGRCRFFTWI